MKRLLLTTLSFLTVASSLSQEVCGHFQMMQRDIENDNSFVRNIVFTEPYSRSTFEQKTLPVIVHIFHEGEAYGQGSHLTQEIVVEAIDHLNYFYAGNGDQAENTFIDFCLAAEDLLGLPMSGIVYHDLNDYGPYTGSLGNIVNGDFYVGLQNTYSYSTSNYLEIFVAPWTQGYNGFTSTPPSNLGIWVRTSRFGFGSHAAPSNLNTTLCHEIGHWSGLLHTFSNGYWSNYNSCEEALQESNCQGYGDYVCDTPATPVNYSCLGSCSDIEADLSNVMDYLPGSCRIGFTIGQIERMHQKLEQFRSTHLNNDFCPECDDINFNEICDEQEYGCTDPIACNYEESYYFEDGSCEYAEVGYSCSGLPSNVPTSSIQETLDSEDIKNYEIFDICGKSVGVNQLVSSGIYIIVIEYASGKIVKYKYYIN